jgi:hypothetical protein
MAAKPAKKSMKPTHATARLNQDSRIPRGEADDVASQHVDIVERIQRIMATAATPSDRYPIGTVYTGGPIWKVD